VTKSWTYLSIFKTAELFSSLAAEAVEEGELHEP
jgi:hypothetical protein